MSSKQAQDMAGLRCFLNELLELKVEDVKNGFVRDFPQKLAGEDVKMELSFETSVEDMKMKILCDTSLRS